MKKPRLFHKTVATGLLAALITGLFAATPAVAASGPLSSIKLTQVTGTAPFDADSTAGFDSSGTNNIVRTNDTVTYRSEITTGSSAAKSAHLYLNIPRGEQVDTLPPYCLAGSTISPKLADPAGGVTAGTWTLLKPQTVDCYLGDLPAASTQVFSITSKVRPEVPNGTTLSAVTSKVVSGTNSLTSGAVSHTVSAKAQYDLTIGYSDVTNGGRVWGPAIFSCPEDETGGCYQTKELVFLITTPRGGKGNSPLLSGFSFDVDLSAVGVYGSQITSMPAWKAAGANAEKKYRPFVPSTDAGCLHNTYPHWGPYTGIGVYNSVGNVDETNSVRDSGNVTCTRDTNTGKLRVTVTGADTSAWTYPTKLGNGNSLPADRAMVFSKSLNINVPITTVKELGTRSGTQNIWTIPQTIRSTEVIGKDLNGAAVAPTAHTKTWNNHKTLSLVAKDEGHWDTYWTGLPGTRGNTPPEIFRPSWVTIEGLPGQGSPDSGDGVMLKEQVGVIGSWNELRSPNPGLSNLSCHVWDSTKLALAAGDWPGSTVAPLQRVGSSGAAVWRSFSALYGGAVQESIVDIEYGYGATGSAATSTCGAADSAVGWKKTPTDPAFSNDPTRAAEGTYTGVNRVRILVKAPDAGRTQTQMSLAMRYIGNLSSGETLPFWSSAKTAQYHTSAAQGADGSPAWSRSTYSPGATSEDPQTGGPGGRALVGEATSRLNSSFADTSGNFDTGTPAHLAGADVSFRLAPTANTPVDTSMAFDMGLEACLPAALSYVAGSASIAPGVATVVPSGQTRGNDIVCNPGETYLNWALGKKIPNDVIDPVTMKLNIRPTVVNGSQQVRSVVSLVGDPSPVANRRSNASVQVESPAGIKVARAATFPVVQVNPGTPATPRQMSWDLEFVNLNSPANISNVEMVEVLPRNGYGKSIFGGNVVFNSATVTRGSNITIQYTNAPDLSIDDSGNPSTATWYSSVAAAGGSGSITGLKVTRPGAFTPTDNLTVRVTVTPLNNAKGDIYEGRVAGKAAGLASPVGPLTSATEVVDSRIGDRLWVDLNKDGLQSAGEPGLSGHTVTLTGNDLNGNPVSQTTQTDSKGNYQFSRFASGTYNVNFGKAALDARKLTLAPQRVNGGSDDSAPSPTTGTVSVAARPGEALTDIDAGVTTTTNLTTTITSNPISGSTSYVSPKDPITYTVVATNRGMQDFSTAVVDTKVTGNLTVDPASLTADSGSVSVQSGTVRWTGPLAQNQTARITFTATVDEGVNDTSTVKATLSGTGTWFAGTQVSTCDGSTAASCSAQHMVYSPKLGLSTTVTQSEPANTLATVDERLTYSFQVRNIGRVNAQNIGVLAQARLGNKLPGVTEGGETAILSPAGAAAVMAPGATMDFGSTTYSYTVNQDDVDWGEVLTRSRATGSTKAGLTTESEPVDTAVATPQTTGLVLQATVEDDNADGTAQVGEDLIYRYKLVNTGLVSLESMAVVDQFLRDRGVKIGAEHTFDGRLSPGESLRFMSTAYQVRASDKSSGAVATDSIGDARTRKAQAVQSNRHKLEISTPSLSGLDLVKRVEDSGNYDGFADLNEELRYTFVLSNNSDKDFHDLKLADPMLAAAGVSWAPAAGFTGTLAPRERITFTAGGYTVTAADATRGFILNEATAAGRDGVNKAVQSNTAKSNIITTSTPVIIKTGAGAGADTGSSVHSPLLVMGGSLLLAAAGVLLIMGIRRRKS